MVYKKFSVDVYDWDVIFIEVTSKNDYKRVKSIQKKFGVSKPTIEEVENNIKSGAKNGGLHSYNEDYRKSLILIYQSSSKIEKLGVMCHEKRHCEDAILEHLSVYDREASAFLAEFLGKKLLC